MSTATEGIALSTASEGDPFDFSSDAADPEDPVQKAAAIAYELNTASDALNEQLERAEQRLASLNLGVSATVTLDVDENGGFDELSFQRRGSDWGFVVATGSHAYPDDLDYQPLLKANREIRTLAATKLDELLAELFRAAHEQIAGVRAAVDKAEAFADRLPEPGQK